MAEADRRQPSFFQRSWGRLDEIIEQFEHAWQSGQRPTIDAYLQAKDVEPGKLLVELAHADMECRLKAGEPVRVETYLERYAELAADRRAALGLIAAEYNLRRRREPGLTLEEYLQRFPQYRADLAERMRGPHQLATGSRPETSPEAAAGDGQQRLGQFVLLEMIGQGAFGAVYRARDTELDRIVAVKVPRGDRSITAADAERFLREARNAASLSHPGIVPVYEVGHDAAVPYIVSAYIEGKTLLELLAGQRLDFRQTAEVMAQVAEALDHAHERGVVHRDLKPSNIILGRIQGSGDRSQESGDRGQGSGVGSEDTQEAEEVSSLSPDSCLLTPDPCLLTPDSCLLTPGTRAFVMDFGLARREEGEVHLTVEGQILGTPAYMSPEQARGQSHRVDGRSDLYSLGVILYELLTGELPFRGTARMILQQILDEEPRSPRRLNDKIPRDLETITLKCLAKERGRRYATAGALAADLRRHLNGEPILARPVGPLERGWRWVQRKPWVAGFCALLVILAVGGPIAALVIRAQKNAEAKARRQAETSSDVTMDTLIKVIFRLQDELRDQPALLGLNEQLNQIALDGLRRMAEVTNHADIGPLTVAAHQRIGDIFLQLGRIDDAREHYEQCRSIAEQLVRTDPQRAMAEHALCLATTKLGEISLRSNDVQAAYAYGRKAVTMAEAFRQSYPQYPDGDALLVLCYNRLGQAQLSRGEPLAAADSYGRAVEFARRALDQSPQSTATMQELANAHANLGNAHLQLNQLREAREAYDQSKKLKEAILNAHPKSNSAKRQLALALEKLGDVDLRTKQPSGALNWYRRALKLFEDLAAAAPQNSLILRDVAKAHGLAGIANQDLGDHRAACTAFEEALKRFDTLAKAYPSDMQMRRDVAIGEMKVGQAKAQLRDPIQARTYLEKALADFGALAAQDPRNNQGLVDLAACCSSLGTLEMKTRDFPSAAQHFKRGLAALRVPLAQGKIREQPGWGQVLGELEENLRTCQGVERMFNDPGFVRTCEAMLAGRLLKIRAALLADKGQHIEAAALAEEIGRLNLADTSILYQQACCFALCVRGVAPGKADDQLTAPEAAQRREYATRAIRTLLEAVKKGYRKKVELESDWDLDAIHAEKDYQQVLALLKTSR